MSTATFTMKQILQGIQTDDVENAFSNIENAIDMLSEGNTELTQDLTFQPYLGTDAAAVANVNNIGVGTGTGSNLADRTYINTTFTLNTSKEVFLEIPFDDLGKYGLTSEMLNSEKKYTVEEADRLISPQLRKEIKGLADKIKQKRRDEVKLLLKNLGTVSAQACEKPLGLNAVDTALSRTTAWTFDNKMAVALTTDTYDDAINLLTDQKTALNQDYGDSAPAILIHAKDYALANTIHKPEISVNVNNRNAGEGIDLSIKKTIGTYGDSVNASDWVLLGINHGIKRIAYDLMGDGTYSNGIIVIYKWTSDDSLKITIKDRSQMIITTCNDLIKSDIA